MKSIISVCALSVLLYACSKNNPIASFTDCIGVENGLAVLDDCGTCHQSYIYDSYTHIPTYINDTLGLVLGAMKK